MLDFLKPGMTFVDIGANVGFYSIIAGRVVGPEGRVLSFEPNSENCRLIMLSASRNHIDNLSLFPFALGDRTGQALFHTHIGSNGGLVGYESEALLNPTVVVVPIARLDDLVKESVDLMKIDVEGAESLVAQGAAGLIRRYRPTVVSEFSLEMLRRVSGVDGLEYLRFWTEAGYSISRLDRETHAPVAIDDPAEYLKGYGEIQLEDLVFSP